MTHLSANKNPASGEPQAGDVRSIARIELWRITLTVLWFGMVAAISFIEAPLKFQAPGITIPLGLGIGRLVFFALNIAEGALLVALLVLSFWPRLTRVPGRRMIALGTLAAVYLVKILIVRPPLNARTDLVISGADPGQSLWHYVYIACDLTTMVLLVVLAVGTARALLRVLPGLPSAATGEPQRAT